MCPDKLDLDEKHFSWLQITHLSLSFFEFAVFEFSSHQHFVFRASDFFRWPPFMFQEIVPVCLPWFFKPSWRTTKGDMAQCPTIRDGFRHGLPLTATPPFEDTEEDEDHHYITSFDDHSKKEGSITPDLFWGCGWRVKSLFHEQKFTSCQKPLSNSTFTNWLKNIMSIPEVSKMLNEMGWRCPIICPRGLLLDLLSGEAERPTLS